MRWSKSVFLLVLFITLTGCVAEMGLREDFDKSIRAYNRMLRWHEAANAGMTYVDMGIRNDFMKQAEDLRKRGVTFTDFRFLTTECLPEKKSGEALVEFDYFILPSNRIKTTTYRQEWIYQDTFKSWKLRSGLPPFD